MSGPHRHENPMKATAGQPFLRGILMARYGTRREGCQMTAFTGVAHISLTVTDLDRSKAWYAERLGWQEVMAGESGKVLFSVGALPGDRWWRCVSTGMG